MIRLVGVVEWDYDEVQQVYLGFLVWIRHGEQWSPWFSDGTTHVPYDPKP